MFLGSTWGFPHKAAKIISQYQEGKITLADTFKMLTKVYGGGRIKTYFTYDQEGKKLRHTCIEFGCPVVVQYVF